MLGRSLVRAFRAAGDVALESNHAAGDISSLGYTHSTVEATRPDVVVNAAGDIPLMNRPTIDTIRANALGPHVIAAACLAHGVPMLHISTDCVFSGRKHGIYDVTDEPDPIDLYGHTKLIGEPPSAVVLRTSFVGPQHGLWQWLRSQPPGASVDGWRSAMWSGSTADAVARAIIWVAHAETLPGTYHLTTDKAISKLEVVSTLSALLGLDLNVRAVDEPVINRALLPSRLMPRLEPFPQAIGAFVREALG